MLNRLTLILRPTNCHAAIQKVLREEHFDHQFGSMKVDGEDTGHTEDVVLVTCVDFHDVGVVLEKLRTRVGLRYYLVDANMAIFSYHHVNRQLNPLGYLIGGVKNVPSYNHHLTIGNKTYSFWESR